MRRGAWHQCGDRSQRLVVEQIQQGVGVGVIISPRDLAEHMAVEYSNTYRQLGADVLIDLQFCNPGFSNDKICSYPISRYRTSISRLNQISEQDLPGFASALRTIQSKLSTNGLIAPAVKYEAGRPDIVQLNSKLFDISKLVADEFGIPTYATVILGNSITSSDKTIVACLSDVTSLNCDGWYYGFEFPYQERIPSSEDDVLRCCMAGLKLAATGKPVLHAYAGPMALLSMAFGATGTGIGHWQNLWQFTRGRWEAVENQGGGGDAPPRFFSRSLWSTIIYPDEVAQLKDALWEEVFTASPFSPTNALPIVSWTRWNANKHLVYSICSTVSEIASTCNTARESANAAMQILEKAISLHKCIFSDGVRLGDNTNIYHSNWLGAMTKLLDTYSDDYDYIELLG